MKEEIKHHPDCIGHKENAFGCTVKSLEQQLQEFREKFGKDGKYLCQYDPDMETHTSNSAEVESFLKEALTTAELRGAERIEKVMGIGEQMIRDEVDLRACLVRTSMNQIEKDVLHPNDTSVL